MTGAPGSGCGGVLGRREVSIGVGLFRRDRSEDATWSSLVSDWEAVLEPGREAEPVDRCEGV